MPFARRPPRLTGGGPTWDLREKRGGGGPRPASEPKRSGPKRRGAGNAARSRVPEADALMILNDSIAGIFVALKQEDVSVSRQLRHRALKYAAMLPRGQTRRQRGILDELKIRIDHADALTRRPLDRRRHPPPAQRPDVTRQDRGPAGSGASSAIGSEASVAGPPADQQSLEIAVSREMIQTPRIGQRQQRGRPKVTRREPVTTAAGVKDVKWAARRGRMDRKTGTACGRYQKFLSTYSLSDSKLARQMWTAYKPMVTKRKRPSRGRSVWTVSGGLPTLGKRAR